jgi:hypothetical protein
MTVWLRSIVFFLRSFTKMPGKYLTYDRVCMPNSFIHPEPLPKRVLHRVRSGASSFNFQHSLFSLMSSSSFLSLLPRLPVTSIIPSFFPSIMCCRRQFLRKMWPIELAFLLFIDVGHSSPPLLYVVLHFSHDRSNSSSQSFFSTTFQSYSDSWPVKLGPIRCPETSVNNYHTKPRNIPE